MSDDFYAEDQLGMAELYAMDRDTFDNAEAYAVIDDEIPIRDAAYCAVCQSHECRHCCSFCQASRPCPCDIDQQFHEQRTFLVRGERGSRTKKVNA